MHRLPGRSMNELQSYPQQQQQYAMGQHMPPMMPPPPRMGPEQNADGPLQLMWRRRWIVVVALMVCVAAAVAYLRVAQPLYTSTAQLTVSGDVINVLGQGGTKADPAIDFMAQQSVLLGSNPVIERALKQHETAKMVTFQEVRDPVAFVKKNLIVEPGRKDGTFNLFLDAPNPEEGAELLNSVVTAYIADRIESDPIANVLDTLTREQLLQQAKLEKLEKELNDFKIREGTLSYETKDTSNVVLEKLAAINDALSKAEIALIAKTVEHSQRNDPARSYKELLAAENNVLQLRTALEAQEELARKLNVKKATTSS